MMEVFQQCWEVKSKPGTQVLILCKLGLASIQIDFELIPVDFFSNFVEKRYKDWWKFGLEWHRGQGRIFQEPMWLTVLRLPLNANTVVVLAQNGQILFVRLCWTNWQRRARGFLYNLEKSSQSHLIRKKQRADFGKKFNMLKNKNKFPNKNVGSALNKWTKK